VIHVRKTARALILAASVVGCTAFLAGPAQAADIGDGKLGCNRFEICFNRDSGNRNYQKHFFYASSHDGFVFTDVRNGKATSSRLRDNAWSVANRDGSCSVKIVDVISLRPDDVHVVRHTPSSLVWVKLNDGVRNQNDRHERC
jgi:hypothetical protein